MMPVADAIHVHNGATGTLRSDPLPFRITSAIMWFQVMCGCTDDRCTCATKVLAKAIVFADK